MTMNGSNIESKGADGADLLFGAFAISQFVFGDKGQRRRVYHLAEKHGLPVFYIGSTICARRSRLRAWLDEKDQHSGGDSVLRGPSA